MDVYSIFEALMIICFGISWPMSLYKSYKSRSTKGKSLLFECFILTGYICGLIGKVPRNGEQFSCEYESLEIQVHTVENHRVMETTVTKREMTEEEEEE